MCNGRTALPVVAGQCSKNEATINLANEVLYQLPTDTFCSSLTIQSYSKVEIQYYIPHSAVKNRNLEISNPYISESGEWISATPETSKMPCTCSSRSRNLDASQLSPIALTFPANSINSKNSRGLRVQNQIKCNSDDTVVQHTPRVI